MKSRNASAFTKFRLLMWKNYLQQIRHPVQTITELVLPVATMALVLVLRSQIEPSTRSTVMFSPLPAYTLTESSMIIGGMNLTHMSVAYSPESPELEDVVRSAMANIIIRNIERLPEILENVTLPEWPDLDPGNITWPESPDDITWPELPWNITWPEIPDNITWPELPDNITWPEIPDDIDINSGIYQFIKSVIRVHAYNNSDYLRGIYSEEETTREVIAAFQFDDDLYGATELPLDVSFSVRFPELPRMSAFYSQGGRSWRSDAVFPTFEMPGPRSRSPNGGNDPGYISEMFIVLQHSLSLELISRLTGENYRNYNVNLQRYPHPPYVQDMAVEVLQMLFPMFIMLAFSYTSVNIVRAVTVEKELQLKETMKIMGLPTWLHWTAWFCKQFVYLLIIAVLMLLLLKVQFFTNEEGFGEYAVFTSTPWTVLFFFLMLYLICVIFFGFMISGFFSKASTAALFTGVIWFLTYIPAFLLAVDIQMSVAVQAITCLSINSAMSYGFQLLLAKESTGGMQWGEFFASPATESSRFVFGHVVIMLTVDCVLYLLLALYLEQVMPGPFGTPKPWYFIFQKSYWFQDSSVSPNGPAESETQSDVVKEKDPVGYNVGVNMTNLTKVYGANAVVNDLTLKIYDDQITVLLGHNGAGKSTTISMLTGNVEVTRGSIWLAGHDMVSQPRAARAHLGLCPQHNVLFNELTVREHLEFFARLKGFEGEELSEDIETLISKLELEEKRNYKSDGLSGGQKRRLCVGIALSGKAKVVLLDEPTSGMDPASRRALWELLQKEKKGRSMILTTHFMDEADILGDRIAIMSHGRLQCVGSPYFLKRHYGVGYSLVVVKTSGFDYDKCTELITKYIPTATIKEDRGSEVTYKISNDYSQKFEDMLVDLENNIEEIKFKNYGFVATTLEDVFMSVGSDMQVNQDSDDGTIPTSDTSDFTRSEFELSTITMAKDEPGVSGWKLLLQQTTAVWLKLLLVWTRSWYLVLLQIAVPLLQINITLGLMQYVMSLMPQLTSRNLTLTEGFAQTETLLQFVGDSAASIGSLARQAYETIYQDADLETMTYTNVGAVNMSEYYLERTEDPANLGILRHRVLIGATFEDESATAWFSNFGYHDVAVSLASLHKALLRSKVPAAVINVHNEPIEATYEDNTDMQFLLTAMSTQLASAIGNSLGIVSAVYILFYIKERVSRAKLLQKAAGVSPAVMWSSAAIFDWVWFMILMITVIISCSAFEVIGMSSAAELGRLYLILMVYGASMLPMHYLFSHIFNGPAVGFVVMFFINVLFGTMGTQIVEALMSPQLDTYEVAQGLDYALQFFPLYSFVMSIRKFNQVGLTEYSCMTGCERLQGMLVNIPECNMEVMCNLMPESCCVRENPYFDWEDPGALRYIICMVVSCAVFWLILMIIEYNLLQKLWTRSRMAPPLDERTVDTDVAEEARHAQLVQPAHPDHSLVARGLTKYYGNHLAVNQVSFTVSDSECFGLLGVNGAGKTTTFKMLMGDETVSSGDAFVAGHSVKTNIPAVHENIGYCPQFDAVFGELTGRETMRLFSLMRGIPLEHAEPRALALAHALGFYKHYDKRVDQYSGGNKRKLSTAVALLGRTRLVFVDEPTTGVDPAAKRQVWRAIRSAQRAGRGLVLTSHSMEECEALCSRLTIMVNGHFQCLGTPQHLKNKFSQGFTLTIKMKIEEDQILDQYRQMIDEIKRYVESNFQEPKLMEEYQGLLTYYLPARDVAWSRMFGVMERAKLTHSVEDYSISQTTLEQIFLQFTKYQR